MVMSEKQAGKRPMQPEEQDCLRSPLYKSCHHFWTGSGTLRYVTIISANRKRARFDEGSSSSSATFAGPISLTGQFWFPSTMPLSPPTAPSYPPVRLVPPSTAPSFTSVVISTTRSFSNRDGISLNETSSVRRQVHAGFGAVAGFGPPRPPAPAFHPPQQQWAPRFPVYEDMVQQFRLRSTTITNNVVPAARVPNADHEVISISQLSDMPDFDSDLEDAVSPYQSFP